MIETRALSTNKEFAEAVDLQKRIWNFADIELLLKVVPADNILFASEMVGAVRGIDPETGHYFDDTKRYIDAVAWLGEEAKRKIFSENARKVYRLDRRAASPASPR